MCETEKERALSQVSILEREAKAETLYRILYKHFKKYFVTKYFFLFFFNLQKKKDKVLVKKKKNSFDWSFN